ncbi:flagellar biosynthetic protein FliR [Bacillus bombysepticus]|uniref:flagellar biosynthetic protein FliR n=1 Tax=Bacillus bombysepticus TaxID=658666 RepID=UPI00301B25E9
MSLVMWMEVMLLSMARITTFIGFLPFLQGKKHLKSVTLALSAALAWSVVPMRMEHFQIIDSLPMFIFAMGTEVIIGWVLAYAVQVMVASISMAGSIVDTDMGLASGQLFDQSTGKMHTFFSTMYILLFTVAFVQMKGINLLIEGIMYSFQNFEYSLFITQRPFLTMMIDITMSMLVLGLQMALPFMVCMFTMNILLLILHKTSPQINIFANMFIFKIGVGLIFIYCMMPYVGEIFTYASEELIRIQHGIVRYLGR